MAAVKGVNSVKKKLADGSTVWYHYDRQVGGKIDSNAAPKSRSLALAVKAHREAAKPAPDNTVADLIERYWRQFKLRDDRSETTKKDYRRHLNRIKEEFGTLPIAGLNNHTIRKDFYDWRDELAETSKRQADYTLQVLSAMLSWAVDRTEIHSNHILKFTKIYTVDRSDNVWLPEHFMAFSKASTPSVLWAVAFALYTGQRQADLFRLKRHQYNGDVIHLTQSKGGRRVVIPVHQHLKRIITTIPENDHGLFLVSPRDKVPWDRHNFGTRFRIVRKRAGLEEADLRFHDIRGTAVTILSECGCTTQEIAAITGHKLDTVERILERYLSRTLPLARSAMLKYETRDTDPWLDIDVDEEEAANQVANHNDNRPALAV